MQLTENCPRVLEYSGSMEGRTLVGHVFKGVELTSPDVCEINCFWKPTACLLMLYIGMMESTGVN